MFTGSTVFSQLIEHMPVYEFHKCVQRYRGDHRIRRLSCLDQFRGMAFAQLTYRESLRDIEACLRSVPGKLYHMGFRVPIARNTLAVANEKRDWRIFADFALVLIGIAQPLYAGEPWGLTLRRTVYALDSTTIDLCLALFPWAKFRRKKGGIKVHTLFNVRTHIPSFILVTHARVHDVNALDMLIFEPGSVYIMDRAYVDYERLFRIHQANAFFVTRPRKSFRFKRVYSHPVDRTTGVQSDQTVKLVSFYSQQGFPQHLRRIRFVDQETQKKFTFITNNFTWSAATIAKLYKSRWQVELFFKWIKQHLRIKAFFGTSENAVKTQIWISISVYVLVAILKKRLNLERTMYEILQVLSVNQFEKTPIDELLRDFSVASDQGDSPKQLTLFDL
jgi:hypothetical protein